MGFLSEFHGWISDPTLQLEGSFSIIAEVKKKFRNLVVLMRNFQK